MRVRIIRQPHGSINGASLSSYREGEVYDIPPTLADYLVMQEFAMVEMRDRDRNVAVTVERRRKQ